MISKLRSFYFLFPLSGLIIILLVGCGSQGSELPTPTPLPEPTEIPRPVYSVQLGEVADQAIFDAQVFPIHETQLFFTVTGKVKEIFVKAGDVVTRGQLLAVLDTTQEEIELVTSEAELAKQEGDYNHARHKAELGLQIAQMTLDLYKQQNRPEQEIKIQELQVELAQINMDEILEPEDIQVKRDRVAELKTIIANASFFSPANDHVLFVLLGSGRAVDPQTPVVSLGDPTQLEVRAKLTSSDMERLREGMPAAIGLKNKNISSSGSIRLLPAPYGSGSDEFIHIQFEGVNPAELGYQIMGWVRVTIIIDRHENALWLPPEAINDIGGRIFVFIQEGETTRRVDIKLGLVTSERVEILEGLSEGQTIVVP
jgi:multidrug efflux pump subunit AcrA (membrane-fusion protein)